MRWKIEAHPHEPDSDTQTHEPTNPQRSPAQLRLRSLVIDLDHKIWNYIFYFSSAQSVTDSGYKIPSLIFFFHNGSPARSEPSPVLPSPHPPPSRLSP